MNVSTLNSFKVAAMLKKTKSVILAAASESQRKSNIFKDNML